MTDMIEVVARAIYAMEFGDEFPGEKSIMRAMAFQQARAALLAMREPTEEMIQAGAHTGIIEAPMSAERRRAKLRHPDLMAAIVFQAMIDTALKTEEKTDG